MKLRDFKRVERLREELSMWKQKRERMEYTKILHVFDETSTRLLIKTANSTIRVHVFTEINAKIHEIETALERLDVDLEKGEDS